MFSLASCSWQLEQCPVRLQSLSGLSCHQWGRQCQLWRDRFPTVSCCRSGLCASACMCALYVYGSIYIDISLYGFSALIIADGFVPSVLVCFPGVILWSHSQAVAVGLQRETGTTAPPRLPLLPWLNTTVNTQNIFFNHTSNYYYYICLLWIYCLLKSLAIHHHWLKR